MTTAWRLELNLVFPSGVSPGAGSERAALKLARDGHGRPVLRGTALAGRIRRGLNHLEVFCRCDEADYFGAAVSGRKEEAVGEASRFQFEDVVLGEPEDVVERTFHARDRHTGAVLNKSLFSVEMTRPHLKARARIWLLPRAEQNVEEDLEVFSGVVSLFRRGILLGGRGNRGIGLAHLEETGAELRRYDVGENIDDHAAWIADRRDVRRGMKACGGTLVPIESEKGESVLDIRVPLRIPRGQDLLVADGQGMGFDAEPQTASDLEGNQYWLVPGSSFRGTFRSWCHRLAVREFGEECVADTRSARRNREADHGASPTGKDLGWCYDPPDADGSVQPGKRCVVASLFGSLHAPGRIHIADMLIPVGRLEPQVRVHVAVDGITGGCVEGLLFDNQCLVQPKPDATPIGVLSIRVVNPQEHELRWLKACLEALDMGLIRIGSAKSSGRLMRSGAVEVAGTHAELWDTEDVRVPRKDGQ